MAILLNPQDKEIHSAIGKAIQAHAEVEGAQVFVLEALLNVKFELAAILLFSVQNVRARHEMFKSLLVAKHKHKYKSYWDSCGAFLEKLARFRNAAAHWQPGVSLYADEKGKIVRHEHTMLHPKSGSTFDVLTVKDFPAFLDDCRFIYQEFMTFQAHLKHEPHAASPDRFLRPFSRRNQAVLQHSRKVKSRQSAPAPSRACAQRKGRKPSAKQRRQRALAQLAKKRP